MSKASQRWKRHPVLTEYEISEYGDVRRPEVCATRKAGHTLKGSVGKSGYKTFKLNTPSGKRQKFAHRLVLEAFVGMPPPDKPICAHWDGNKTNNHVSNLRWASTFENSQDAVRLGEVRGERNGRARLTETDVIKVRAEYEALPGDGCGKRGTSDLAQKYGLTLGGLYQAATGRNWSHVR